MIIESGHFEYDRELERYIEFEKYGQETSSMRRGVSPHTDICVAPIQWKKSANCMSNRKKTLKRWGGCKC